MSTKITLTLGPVISAASATRGVSWEVVQQNGSGQPAQASGKRADMVKIFKKTIAARTGEGYTVEAKVLTASGQLEEHGTYRPDGTATWHHVPPPAGEGQFGRRCRDLAETPAARKARREATAPPKPAPAPKPARAPKPPKAEKKVVVVAKAPKPVKPPKPAPAPKATRTAKPSSGEETYKEFMARVLPELQTKHGKNAMVMLGEAWQMEKAARRMTERTGERPKSAPAAVKTSKAPKPKATVAAPDDMGAQFDKFIGFAMQQGQATA